MSAGPEIVMLNLFQHPWRIHRGCKAAGGGTGLWTLKQVQGDGENWGGMR